MFTGQDPDAVQRQYADANNLRIMQETHDLYTSPMVDFPGWVLDRCMLRGNERVLDVGAGSGRYYSAIMRRYPEIQYTAVDISPGMLTAHAADQKVAGDAAALPFPNASFDVVMANHMLYHVPDVDAGLKEMQRILKPGGILVAATNSAASMPQFSELMRRGILLLSKPGSSLVQLPPAPQMSFSLENGAQQLRHYFYAVVRHDLPGALVFPDPLPALRYLDTWRSMREPQLPLGVKWDDVMLVVRDQINRIIKHFGELAVEKVSGVLIASNSGGFIAEYQRIASNGKK